MLDWIRHQAILRPLGVMRANILYDAATKQYTVLLSEKQYASLEAEIDNVWQKIITAAVNKNNKEVHKLISTTSPKTINHIARTKRTKQNEDMLHVAAIHFSETNFHLLIHQITPEFFTRKLIPSQMGFLFNISGCKINNRFAIDMATHHKPWIDPFREDVKAYQASIQSVYYASETDFQDRIRKNPFIHNELLMQIPYGEINTVLCAIIIAKDTLNARKLAREQKTNVRLMFKLDLPILFYDRFTQSVTPYSSEMQWQDIKIKLEQQLSSSAKKAGYPGFSFNKAMTAKRVLLEIKTMIMEIYPPSTFLRSFPLFSFFRLPGWLTESQNLIQQAEEVNSTKEWFISAEKIRRLATQNTNPICQTILEKLATLDEHHLTNQTRRLGGIGQ